MKKIMLTVTTMANEKERDKIVRPHYEPRIGCYGHMFCVESKILFILIHLRDEVILIL